MNKKSRDSSARRDPRVAGGATRSRTPKAKPRGRAGRGGDGLRSWSRSGIAFSRVAMTPEQDRTPCLGTPESAAPTASPEVTRPRR